MGNSLMGIDGYSNTNVWNVEKKKTKIKKIHDVQ